MAAYDYACVMQGGHQGEVPTSTDIALVRGRGSGGKQGRLLLALSLGPRGAPTPDCSHQAAPEALGLTRTAEIVLRHAWDVGVSCLAAHGILALLK